MPGVREAPIYSVYLGMGAGGRDYEIGGACVS